MGAHFSQTARSRAGSIDTGLRTLPGIPAHLLTTAHHDSGTGIGTPVLGCGLA